MPSVPRSRLIYEAEVGRRQIDDWILPDGKKAFAGLVSMCEMFVQYRYPKITGAAVWLVALLGLAPALGAQATPAVGDLSTRSENAGLIDRIVAVVDDDPILWSEVERAIELGFFEARDGESRAMLERRVLDSLIEQRLRLHELDRYGAAEIEVATVESQIEAAERKVGGAQELDAVLDELQMSRAALEALFVRQLKILRFVEERLGPRVFVDLEAIRAYYDGEFSDRWAEITDPDSPLVVPPLADVREQIRAVLRERLLNEEIDKWTQELRRAADVVDFLEQ